MSTTGQPTTEIPVVEDLFMLFEGAAALIGSRCTGCGSHYFPKTFSCRNPDCQAKNLEQALLGRTGRLYSWTVQAYRPPALFRMDPWQPYALGLVEVAEGIRILAMLTGAPLSAFSIGQQVRLVLEPICTDESGREVLTYKYAPAARGATT